MTHDKKKMIDIDPKFCDKLDYSQPRYALFSFIDKKEQNLALFLDKVKKHDDYNALPGSIVHLIQDEENKEPSIAGVGKIRGVFYTEQEAAEKAEEIIRFQDSANSIFTCRIGVPFPLVPKGYAQEVEEVNLQEETENTIKLNVREKRKKEEREIQEIKRREEELRADVEKTQEERIEDTYISQRVKLAQLRSQIEAHKQKLMECTAFEETCIKWLLKTKESNPEFEKCYIEKYMNARKQSNIPTDYTSGLMKFLQDPIEKTT